MESNGLQVAIQDAWYKLDLQGEERSQEATFDFTLVLDKAKELLSNDTEEIVLKRKALREAQKEARSHIAYKGPVMDKHSHAVTVEHVRGIYKFYCADPSRHIPAQMAKRIARLASHYYMALGKAMVKIKIPHGTTITVIGDTHGQLIDVLTLLKARGFPSATQYYLFNGDLVDRGPQGPGVITLVLALKLAYPGFVFVNRGNHEDRAVNRKYAFEDQCIAAYGHKAMEEFAEVYKWLPYCSLIAKKVFVVHGGLTQYEDLTLAEIAALPLGFEHASSQDPLDRAGQIRTGLLWSDPMENVHTWEQSRRGAGVHFGAKLVHSFLKRNHLDFLVRSHQVVQEGYEVMFNGTLATLFSASYYDGKNTNKAAVASFHHGRAWNDPEFTTFTADVFAFTGETEEQFVQSVCKNMVASTMEQLVHLFFEKRHALLLKFEETCEKRHALTPQLLAVSQSPRQTKEQRAKNKSDKEERDKAISKGLVSVQEWVKVMEEVLGLDLQWDVLQPYIVREKNGFVSYRKFLDRFRINMTSKDAAWLNGITKSLCEQLRSASCSIAEMFEKADTDKNNKLSYNEFAAMLRSYNVELTDNQIYDFMEVTDTNHDGFVDFSELYTKLRDEFSNTDPSNDPNLWIFQTFREVGRKLYEKYGEPQLSWDHIMGPNRKSLDLKGFSKIVGKYASGSFTDEEIEKLFNAVDTNRSGGIRKSEWKSTFAIDDSTSWQFVVVQRILGVITHHQLTLERVFKCFDIDGSGLVSPAEFKAGLQALNIFVSDPLTDTQINILHDFLDTDKDGFISYQEFLSAFHVHDLGKSKLPPIEFQSSQ